MDIWMRDLGLAALLAQEQYEEEREAADRRLQQMSRQYQQEIAAATQELYAHIASASRALGAEGEEEIILAQGARELPLYAFYQVIRGLGGEPTQEQAHLLDVYCTQLQLPYNDLDFLLAVNAANGLRQRLEGMFALPEGRFWQVLLALLEQKEQAEAVLDTIVQKYGDIVMRFSLLGDPESEAPMAILQQMVDRLNEWLAEHAREQEPEAADYVQAYRRMWAAYEEAAARSGAEQDGLPVTDLFVFFVLGLVHKLLQSARLSMLDKAAVLDGVMRSCEVPAQLSGMSVMESIYAKDEIGGSMEMMTEFGPEHGNLWQIVRAMSMKCGRPQLAAEFMESAGLFMAGLETALQKEYPGRVRAGQAAEYMGQVGDELE